MSKIFVAGHNGVDCHAVVELVVQGGAQSQMAAQQAETVEARDITDSRIVEYVRDQVIRLAEAREEPRKQRGVHVRREWRCGR